MIFVVPPLKRRVFRDMPTSAHVGFCSHRTRCRLGLTRCRTRCENAYSTSDPTSAWTDPMSDPMWKDALDIGPDIGLARPDVRSDVGPPPLWNVLVRRPTWVDIGRHGPTWADIDRYRLRHRPTWADTADISRHRPTWADIGSDMGRHRPTSVAISRHRRTLVRQKPLTREVKVNVWNAKPYKRQVNVNFGEVTPWNIQ